MSKEEKAQYIAFSGSRCIAQGAPVEVLSQVKEKLDQCEISQTENILIFDQDSRPVEWDFRGTLEEVKQRLHAHYSSKQPAPQAGPGRPKLGVVAREVTLLPRHWEWLSQQQGGASVALRKLVEEASRRLQPQDQIRHAQEITYRFMNAMAGDLPHYEEALRALYAAHAESFAQSIEQWPSDLKQHVEKLAMRVFQNSI